MDVPPEEEDFAEEEEEDSNKQEEKSDEAANGAKSLLPADLYNWNFQPILTKLLGCDHEIISCLLDI